MFGGVAFGLNPKALPGFLQNGIVSGTVSIGIGDNREAGGSNDSSYGFGASLAHGTVEIGGKTGIEGGAWVIQVAPQGGTSRHPTRVARPLLAGASAGVLI